ncbi:MAG: Gfo/Idh/MocA family oxidoreductase [Actinomycetota bacterium]
MTSTLRFGVLGAARIAPKALIDPVAKLPDVQVTRVAARDRGRAEAFAAEHGIAAVADGYQDLIEADDVDVVYNPLPMSHHAHWTIAALRAGKHVFCEKPFAANAGEAAEMIRVAEETGLALGEAFHYRYHPLFGRILDEVRSGRLGRLRHLEARFEITIGKPDLRWDYATAGGSLMDLGCYPVSWVRHIVGEEPTVTAATVEADGDDPLVDAAIEARLAFPSGATATVASSMVSERGIGLVVEGTDGRVVVDNPMAPQAGNSLTIETAGGTTSGPVDAGVSYDHMVRAFVDHLVHGADFPTRGQDSIANMAAIDAIYIAAGLPVRGEAEHGADDGSGSAR